MSDPRRLMPVIPFVLVSYAGGLSGVRPIPYALGTGAGVLPGSIMYVGIGASMTQFASWMPPAHLALLLIAALILVLLGAGFGGRWRRIRSTGGTFRPAEVVGWGA